MKIKKVIAIAVAVVVLIGGAGFGFMRWHNQKMKEMQEKCDREIELAKEEEARRIEVERSLDELAKKNKELADAVEIARTNRNSWEAKYKAAIKNIKDKISDPVVVIDSAEIKHEILKINELAVMEYKYRNTGMIDAHDTFNISFLNGKKIPFSSKMCIISMDGTIKVGIDANKVDVEADNKSKKITIQLPESKVLSNELDEKSIYVYSEDDSFFNRLSAKDHSNIRQQIKNDATRLAQDNGIIKQADDRVKELIKTMLEKIPNIKDNYEIEFKTIE